MKKCNKCGTPLDQGNTTHSPDAKWCDKCWTKYWDARWYQGSRHAQPSKALVPMIEDRLLVW